MLRQDPDVILVGEIRDLETLDTALKAADTGHLVFSTLHTTDATQTINRILSFYPPPSMPRFGCCSPPRFRRVSLRLVPRADGRGRVPAAEVLINTAAVAENIRDLEKALHIPDLIAAGTTSYGAPFHCALMQPAADVMADALDRVNIRQPAVPLIANVLAAPISNPSEIRQRLVEQFTRQCAGAKALLPWPPLVSRMSMKSDREKCWQVSPNV